MSVPIGYLNAKERAFLRRHGLDPDAIETVVVASQAKPAIQAAFKAELFDRLKAFSRFRLLRESEDGGAWTDGKINVIASVAREQDGRHWLHVSLSQKHRLPSYAEMARIKELFLGDRRAIHVFPPRAEHVNLAEVLHLWSCWDEDPLPDFSRGVGSI